MELPEQFKQFNYIIEVVRHFISPDFLKTKQDCLKFFCRNIYNCSPYRCGIKISDIDSYLTIKTYPGYYKTYNIERCTYVENRDYDTNEITNSKEKELTQQDLFKLLNGGDTQDTEEILRAYIDPISNVIQLIEKEYNKKIYPLDKDRLLNIASYKFIQQFMFLFENKEFNKNIDEIYIKIKNNFNDHVISIPKNFFEMYCGISTSIKEFADSDVITVPFEFRYRSKVYLKECLKEGKFVNLMERINEEDFNEFKQLISYLQISFA